MCLNVHADIIDMYLWCVWMSICDAYTHTYIGYYTYLGSMCLNVHISRFDVLKCACMMHTHITTHGSLLFTHTYLHAYTHTYTCIHTYLHRACQAQVWSLCPLTCVRVCGRVLCGRLLVCILCMIYAQYVWSIYWQYNADIIDMYVWCVRY